MNQIEATRIGQIRKQKPIDHQPEKAHTPCVGTHVFVWGGIAAEKGPPEGCGCNCGMFELHYSTCGCGCGSRSMSLGFKRRELARHGPRKSKLKH